MTSGAALQPPGLRLGGGKNGGTSGKLAAVAPSLGLSRRFSCHQSQAPPSPARQTTTSGSPEGPRKEGRGLRRPQRSKPRRSPALRFHDAGRIGEKCQVDTYNTVHLPRGIVSKQKYSMSESGKTLFWFVLFFFLKGSSASQFSGDGSRRIKNLRPALTVL